MNDPDNVVEVYLRPGDLHFGSGATRIRTVLGSCVSVVFWHPRLTLGGMCHFMLPSRPSRPADARDGRYADEALELMLGRIRAAGTSARDFRIQMFGGGNMFPDITLKATDLVGSKNVAAARDILAAQNLPISAEHVEGIGHRHIVFDVWSGAVRFKRLAPIALPAQDWGLGLLPA